MDFIEAINSKKPFYEYPNNKVTWKMEDNKLKRLPPNGNHWYSDGGEFIYALVNKRFKTREKKKTITESQLRMKLDNAIKRYRTGTIPQKEIVDVMVGNFFRD